MRSSIACEVQSDWKQAIFEVSFSIFSKFTTAVTSSIVRSFVPSFVHSHWHLTKVLRLRCSTGAMRSSTILVTACTVIRIFEICLHRFIDGEENLFGRCSAEGRTPVSSDEHFFASDFSFTKSRLLRPQSDLRCSIDSQRRKNA